jgi:hypothetical protein
MMFVPRPRAPDVSGVTWVIKTNLGYQSTAGCGLGSCNRLTRRTRGPKLWPAESNPLVTQGNRRETAH